METVYRQKRFGLLTKAQQQAKLQKDSEYEIAVQNLSAAFYSKKRSVGATPEEETSYNAQKAALWDAYVSWAKAEGLYQEVGPQQLLDGAEEALSHQLDRVNEIRAELGLDPKQLTEASS